MLKQPDCEVPPQSSMVSSTPVLGKRKRAEVSYAELDINDIDDDLGEENVVQGGDEMTDGDTTYGSRKVRPSCFPLQIRSPTHLHKTLRSATRNKKRVRLTAPKPKKEKKQEPFPFLSLPAELRDYIYELALTEAEGITLVSTTKSFRRIVCRGEIDNTVSRYRRGVWTGGSDDMPARANTMSPNLLAVNKQIHAEGLAWLYQQPLFLQDTMTLHTFLATIGPENRKIVTDITVEGWGGGRGTHKAMNVASLTSMADCTNLKTFRLDCDVAWYRKPRDLARQLYRDGHYFFERFGSANGKKDAIVDVLELNDNNFSRGNRYGWGMNNVAPNVEESKEMFAAEMSKLLGC